MGEARATPQAAEVLYALLKDASRVVGGLGDADGEEDRASLLVGLKDVVDYTARVLGAAYGPDPHYTLQQARGLAWAAAHVLGDAEVRANQESGR